MTTPKSVLSKIVILIAVANVLILLYWNRSNNVKESSMSDESARPEPKFLLIWATASIKFTYANRACIDSLFLFHPFAHVHVLSDTLSQDFFRNWTRLGYDISITPLKAQIKILGDIIQDPSVTQWVFRASQNEFHPSHVTEVLSLAYLYGFGGSYINFDSIWVGSINGVNRGVATPPVAEQCEKCVVPVVLMGFPAKFEPLRNVLVCSLKEADGYLPSTGFRAAHLMKAYLSQKINTLSELFYPLGWKEAQALYQVDGTNTYLLQNFFRSSILVPLNGKSTTTGYLINPTIGSVAHELFEKVSLTCQNNPYRMRKVGPEMVGLSEATQHIGNFRFMDCGAKCHKGRDCESKYSLRISSMHRCGISVDKGEPFPAVHLPSSTLTEINSALSTLSYNKCISRDSLAFSVTSLRDGSEISWMLSLYDLRKIVTIIAKTMGMGKKVGSLIDSVRKYYPAVKMLIADDGGDSDQMPKQAKDNSLVTYLEIDYDAGLSIGRNMLVERTDTEYVLHVDDDFVFTGNTDLAFLIHQLENTEWSIIGMKNPVDEKRWGFDFSLNMEQRGTALYLKKANSSVTESGCVRVDVIPNLFLATRSSLSLNPWDSRLKVGEHEEFFFRLKLHDIQVATCSGVSVLHSPTSSHWLKLSSYDHNRQRAHQFMKLGLIKHNITALYSVFGGKPVVELVEGEIIDPQQLCAVGLSGPKCDSCKKGFMGPHCRQCQEGFSGPLCERCSCYQKGVSCTCFRGGSCALTPTNFATERPCICPLKGDTNCHIPLNPGKCAELAMSSSRCHDLPQKICWQHSIKLPGSQMRAMSIIGRNLPKGSSWNVSVRVNETVYSQEKRTEKEKQPESRWWQFDPLPYTLVIIELQCRNFNGPPPEFAIELFPN